MIAIIIVVVVVVDDVDNDDEIIFKTKTFGFLTLNKLRLCLIFQF